MVFHVIPPLGKIWSSEGRSQRGASTIERGSVFVSGTSENEPEKNLELTLALTDEGECRFRIDGEGDYLRWQVARKALEEIFFYGLFPKKNGR